MPSLRTALIAWSAFFLLVLLYTACRKVEYKAPARYIDITSRFFQGSQDAGPAIAGISASIRRQNEQVGFLADLVSRIGYPLWNKTKHAGSTQEYQAQTSRSIHGGGNSYYYIPFVKDTSTVLGAVLIVRISSSDTTFRLLYHWQYQSLSFTKTADTSWAASDVFHLFTSFQRDIFGQTKFVIRDSRLLKSPYTNRRGAIATIRPHNSADTLSLSIAGLDCDGYDYCYNPSGDEECPGGGCKKDCEYWLYETWNCTDYTILPGNGGGGAPSGGDNGGDSGSGTGGGNGAGGNWYDNPCRSIAAAGSNPCDGSGGNGSGWEPVIHDEPYDPYTADDVILDTSITRNYPCVQKIVDSLSSYLKVNAIAQVALHTIFNVDKHIHLTFSADPTLDLKDTLDGITKTDSAFLSDANDGVEFYGKIRLNPWMLRHATQEYIASVIIHEAVHAYINFKFRQYKNGIIDSTTFKNLFPIFWSPRMNGIYTPEPSNMIQHNAMAGSLIDIMSAPLVAINPNIPIGFRDSLFHALSWGGLEETTSWAHRTDTNNIRALMMVARDTAVHQPFHLTIAPNVDYNQDHTTLNLKTTCN